MATATAHTVSQGAPAGDGLATWLIEQEAEALLTRLGRVKPYALQETMLPAAALTPVAQVAIDRLLIGGRIDLREQVLRFLDWLRGPGGGLPAEAQQRRFTLVRMRFNDVLSQFDLFSNVITQRSENENGVWLAGLDVLATDALSVRALEDELPEVVCYLERGPGAAIRRARTRLPGGEQNPVAIVRVPRERMVGHGIGSSLVHEVGHQGAALLGLVPSLRTELRARQRVASPAERTAWLAADRWISEIVADLWSVATLGIGSTLGLIGVVSLPAFFVFRLVPDDPHPVPWIRVRLSCALGRELYPDPQWDELEAVWCRLYPASAPAATRISDLISATGGTMAELASLICNHRPPALHGVPLRAALTHPNRTPDRLAALGQLGLRKPSELRSRRPAAAIAALGQARWRGELSPKAEGDIVARLLTFWALRATFDLSAICADHQRERAIVRAQASPRRSIRGTHERR
jgi:hypothetical protein